MGCAGLDPVVRVPGIEGQAEAFALLDYGGVTVPAPWVGSAGGAGLGLGVGEEEMVGDVLVAVRALLGQVVGPAEEVEDRPDEVLLGDCLVGLPVLGESLVDAGEAAPEAGVGGRGGRPFRCGLYSVGKEVVRE